MEDKEKYNNEEAPEEKIESVRPEEGTNEVGKVEEKVDNKVELTPSEEIETEWARTLHIDYDAEEARRRAEAVQPPVAPVPPPMPQQTPPPAPYSPVTPQPAPAPQPESSQSNTSYGHPEPMPNTYLAWAVAATVLCCLIPGVVAIIYSTMVSTKYYARDYDGARKASEYAQYWIIASIVLGVISAAVYLPISILVNG